MGFLLAASLSLGIAQDAEAFSESQIETSTRFLEFDETAGLIAYDVSLRNLGNLPVSFIELGAEPASLEGPLELSDLGKGQMISRRFSFQLSPESHLFQPRFRLGYTDFEGQRIEIKPEKRLHALTIDFTSCDIASGQIEMELSILNISPEPLIFVELKAEHPQLVGGTLALGDLKVGTQLTKKLMFQVSPGETFFNPTIYLTYHAFQAELTKRHRSFTTILQPDLRRIETALQTRQGR